ncbi:MAG TPA: RodZ domain-containing protein [Candidatus Sulfotelmatobacter sp.]|nr:RodZ domain-containing protein [Candidatus Sulfotelmatobacter sp.]
MGHFGDKFRKAREGKNLSLDDVSNVTKISARMLEAIEKERFDQLPGGVFNRGFIRAYAKHLGLDSEEAVNDYLACLRQAQIDSHQGWDAPKPTQPQLAKPAAVQAARPQAAPPKMETSVEVEEEELPELQLPRVQDIRPSKKEYLGRIPSGPPWTLIALALIVVIAAAILWVRHSRLPQTASATPAAPVVAAAATPTATTNAPPPANAPHSSAPAQSSTPHPETHVAQTSPAPQVAATHATTTSPASPAPPEMSQVRVEKKGDVTIRSFGNAPADVVKTPAEKPAPKLTLVIRASENSWISVTADGQLVTQETLIAPAATSYHAARQFVVRVGNAAGVTFIWNGQELPAQGAEAEAKSFVFDAQGMRAPASDPTPQ